MILKGGGEMNMTGNQLKQLIKESNLTQAYIAKEVGISASQLWSFLNGKSEMPKHKYYRVCELLNIDVTYGTLKLYF